MQHLVGQIFPVEGILQRRADVVVAAGVALLVEGDIVHVRRGEGADLVGAGVAQVGIAAGVVDDDVDVRVLKGGDDILGREILLEVDHVHGQVVVAVVAVEGQQLGSLFIIHIGAAAHGMGVAVGADLDHRDVQQLDELFVRDAQGDDELGVGIGHALHAGKAAGIAVGVDAVFHAHAQVVALNGRAVVEDVGRVIGQGPGLAVLAAHPLGDEPRALDHLEVVVQFHQVLIDQRADQLVRVVGGHRGVEGEVAVGVEREHMVGRVALFDVPAAGGIEGIALVLAARAAARGKKQHRGAQQRRQELLDGFFHSFTSVRSRPPGCRAGPLYSGATSICRGCRRCIPRRRRFSPARDRAGRGAACSRRADPRASCRRRGG